MDGATSFWLSLILAVPIGIGVNLLTPAIQRVWARRSAKAQVKLAEQDAQRQALVDSLAKDEAEYVVHLISATLQIAVITALTGLFSGLLFIGGNLVAGLPLGFRNIGVLITSLGQLVNLVGIIATFTIARTALKIARRVRARRSEVHAGGDAASPA